MATLKPKLKTNKTAVIWLDRETLVLGLPSEANQISVYTVDWNSEKLNLESLEAVQKLTGSLSTLAKQHNLTKFTIRLCLADSLAVTRVVTGDLDSVEIELEQLKVRSQLYISLGLGKKLTGNYQTKLDHQTEYALTTIVNQRMLQAIYGAFLSAKLSIESIEPMAISLTNAFGLLGLDSDRPVLYGSIHENHCDLGISRSGRLMLAYPISGFKEPGEVANQIKSNLVRLQRFCQRVRGQENRPLETIYLFGESESIQKLTSSLKLNETPIQVVSMSLPDGLKFEKAEGISDAILVALWSAISCKRDSGSAPPVPDLLEQLQLLQSKPLSQRLVTHFAPTIAASFLILATLGLTFIDHRYVVSKKLQSEATIAEAAAYEFELEEWEAKKHFVESYRILDEQLRDSSWKELVGQIAPCLPSNARLEALTVSDDSTISLRGSMFKEDTTYEMLSALKQLPAIAEVSLESVNTNGDLTKKLQFEVKCRLFKSKSPATPSVTNLTQR
jgi:hypothetical protein